ncbi:MAG: DUF1638 domain-containing protein [Anaerolineales bacterium]|nr:DUF1638 domain-containing protein [Anaerolineales bacterium]
MNNTPIIVIACRVFQNWLENILPVDMVSEITFFDYALHQVPQNLRQTIQSAIDSIEQPSLIILGYGLCGNGLHEINSGKHTLLIPRTDDCIAIILGSYQSYRREFAKEPATYYLSKGWLEGGSTPLGEYHEYVRKYGAQKAEWLMDYQYRNYKRLVLIAQNSQDLEEQRPAALEVAEYCQRWGLRYDEIIGADSMLRQLFEIAAGSAQIGDDFLLVPPGSTLTQNHFIR